MAPSSGRWRQEDREFKAGLCYVTSSFMSSLGYKKPCLEKKARRVGGENQMWSLYLPLRETFILEFVSEKAKLDPKGCQTWASNQAPLELALAALDQAGSHRKASAAKVWPSRPRHTSINLNCPQLQSGFPCSPPLPYRVG